MTLIKNLGRHTTKLQTYWGKMGVEKEIGKKW
jgi:hypothetical protein